MTTPTRVREPAVAGLFYPQHSRALAREVDALLADARPAPDVPEVPDSKTPKALIVPHAGYVYSGPVAAIAYARLAAARDTVRRVVVVGPAHRAPLDGLAVPSVDALRTPLGDVPIDADLRDRVVALPHVTIDDGAHVGEHSLEVHLPFLQRTLSAFTVLPLVVGAAPPDHVAAVLDAVWGGPETLLVISSDLSHYESHDAATAHDERTVAAILGGRSEDLGRDDACGRIPIAGLMQAAPRHVLRPIMLDRRTSGDTAGPRDRVVGYAAIAYV